MYGIKKKLPVRTFIIPTSDRDTINIYERTCANNLSEYLQHINFLCDVRLYEYWIVLKVFKFRNCSTIFANIFCSFFCIINSIVAGTRLGVRNWASRMGQGRLARLWLWIEHCPFIKHPSLAQNSVCHFGRMQQASDTNRDIDKWRGRKRKKNA